MLLLMGLFFLVVCAVGILRPIKNALALDGLGASDFYQVYFVSAAVVLFVPPYNWLAERLGSRRVIPLVALFFAANLVVFRAAFREGSAALGMLFYGWYDLFAAVLVSQFFMATQMYFDARNAKRAYPLVVAGGSLGATLGGAITGFSAEIVGTANLLLVAAGFIAVFGLALPWVWKGEEGRAAAPRGLRRKDALDVRQFRAVFASPHVRLIAGGVLLTVVVKQLVDYQFNALTLEVFETRDGVSAFQGKFNAATQWLPLVVAAALGPILRRWGVGVAVCLLPGSILIASLSLAAWWSLWGAVAAKTAETAFRYSAERTTREILYVPVPEEIKLHAKSYIDVAIEKGVGKVVAAALIFALLQVVDYRELAYVSAGLSLLWLLLAVEVRREYVRTLARSLEGRFASLRGIFASLSDASSLQVVRRVLTGGNVLQTAFALELLDQARDGDLGQYAEELHRLLEHPAEEIRVRALATLGKCPERVDGERVRSRLLDPAPSVRQAAVRVLCAARPAARAQILAELLASPEPSVRTAALTCLSLGEISTDGVRVEIGPYVERWWRDGSAPDPGTRLEIALAAGSVSPGGEEAERVLSPLLADPDPQVAAAALRSAGLLSRPRLYPQVIAALRWPATRSAARDALARQGRPVIGLLREHLLDESGDAVVRRSIPAVLARIPAQESVDLLLDSLAAPETDQLLDYRSLRALNRLRTRYPGLVFDPERIEPLVERELEAAGVYAASRVALEGLGAGGAAVHLLRRTLAEAWSERREGTFRYLGLLHPPEPAYRCYLAITRGSTAVRANGLEWLEQTIGYERFARLAPVLPRGREAPRPPAPEAALCRLWGDGDSWVARCALWTSAELRLPGVAPQIERLRASRLPDQRSLADRLRVHPPTAAQPPGAEMDLIEKVFLLQEIDLLQGARSAHLALLASIAEEVEVDPGTVLIRQGEPTDALYVVVRGAAELRGLGDHRLVVSDGMSFGTWAMIDPEASLLEARVIQTTHLLRLTREHFYDLLADHPELATGLLQGLARRVRTLVA